MTNALKLLGRVKLLELDEDGTAHALLLLNLIRKHLALLKRVEAAVGESLTGLVGIHVVTVGAMHDVSA